MTTHNRVIWSEGLFLRPHHFQQSERFLERRSDARLDAVQAHGWGFSELELDDEALKLGRVGLRRARGVMPDGTPFSIPHDLPAPAPLEIAPDQRDRRVFLALPIQRSGMPECSLNSVPGSGLTRYVATDARVEDGIAETRDSADMKLGQLNLRLVVEGEPNDAYLLLAVAKVAERRADQHLLLDADFIVPSLDTRSSRKLHDYLRELDNLVRHRGNAVADRLGQPGQKGVADISDFLMLQLLNRYSPLLAHLLDCSPLHPESLYRMLLGLAGELATHTHPDRLPTRFGAYRHDALYETFDPLIADLRASLTAVTEQNVVPIAIEDRGRGLYTAMIPEPELVRSGVFVLAVKANLPVEQLRQAFPSQVKIGPSDKIRDLVMAQLPGIMLSLMPVAPRQIPYHAGFCYFELSRSGEFWKNLESNRLLALHVAGSFPDLQLELWALRN